ncbi:uncharacterized protein MCYG_02972 [Microsporum canis CBS 113480]|uniref:Uncharacterized protein n=1 Tax=Arthroderma otae (strain ATCC MYA-4605 / CBS 113480) TaxID=554155 RepID=C5FKD1_ARTOC|nr:uncharacterized protein MCYG_02972 [Microsporum canis CBS 113480]EEQ30153.1 predicted protein [Microsporum canis CBS 113480]
MLGSRDFKQMRKAGVLLLLLLRPCRYRMLACTNGGEALRPKTVTASTPPVLTDPEVNSRDLKRMSGQAGGQDTCSFDITLAVALRQYNGWLLWMVFLLWDGVSATPGPQNELSGPRVILRMGVAQQTATYSFSLCIRIRERFELPSRSTLYNHCVQNEWTWPSQIALLEGVMPGVLSRSSVIPALNRGLPSRDAPSLFPALS